MIYIVEDDKSIRELVVYTLNNTGFTARGFAFPSEFKKALSEEIPQLISLDIMLPEEDGLELLKQLRLNEATAKLPIMMITAKGTENDKVLGLDLGADDYIPKPFGMMELAARVKALLRRANAQEKKKEYSLGSLWVCPEKHTAKVNDTLISLTKKEFNMLCYLLENMDTVLTRNQILNRVWGYSFDGENRTVDVHVRSLRQKLGDAGELIETVRGIGYKIGDQH